MTKITNRINSLLAILLLASTFLTAQNADKCATDKVLKSAIQKDPSLIKKIEDWEIKTQEYIKNHATERSLDQIYSIPVVIHIIHNGEPVGEGTNISDEQIFSQIARLNEDFRKQNADSLDANHPYYPIQADCEIEFCLAQRDPNGNPTTGIYRYNMLRPSWELKSIDSLVKPLTIWNRYDYMNIWSINIQDPNAPGVDGFGSFSSSTSDTTDGVVISNTSFGVVNGMKFITGTHEVGHYLNLHHVWGDNQPNCGDDLVGDTPPSSGPNSGCPDFPHNPNDSCGTGPNGDIFMNFMDYSDAVCTVMFTAGQKERMRANLETDRASLLASTACTPVSSTFENIAENNFDIFPNPNDGHFTINLKMLNEKNTGINVCNFLGEEMLKVDHIEKFPYYFNLSHLSNGVYFIKLNSGNSSTTKTVIISK